MKQVIQTVTHSEICISRDEWTNTLLYTDEIKTTILFRGASVNPKDWRRKTTDLNYHGQNNNSKKKVLCQFKDNLV